MKSEQHYGRLKQMILACMILVPLIPFILVINIGYYYFTSTLENNAIASTRRIVEDHRHMIDSFLQERKSDLEFILRSFNFDYLADQENLLEVFERLQVESNAFVDLGVFNQEGVHVSYQGPFKLSGRVYKDADWFSEVMQKGYYISDIFLGYRRVPHFVIALLNKKNDKPWIIRATIDTYIFTDIVKKVRIGKTGEAYLISEAGTFQTERRSGGNLMAEDPGFENYPKIQQGIKTFRLQDAVGIEYIYATTWLKDKDWLLVVRQEVNDAFKSLNRASYMILLVSIIGGAGILVAAFYLTGKIVSSLLSLDTEKDRLEEQLIRASRLAELGEMSAGFAHEINNPLQIIKSEQALIKMLFSDLKENNQINAPEEMAEIEDSINQIELQINRCSGITQSILKFGRKTEVVPQDIDLKDFISSVTDIVARKASVNGVEIEMAVPEETPRVHVDPGQLQQVLLNLFNNAMDAIYEKHGVQGGKLVIASGASANGMVEINVTDNGCGISEEDRQKIFSPFYTTKPVGHGTGLGLSVCYGIINAMGGSMAVESQKGIGTTFKVKLPSVKA